MHGRVRGRESAVTHAVKVLHTEIAICAGAVASRLQLIRALAPTDERLMVARVGVMKRHAARAWSCAEMLEATGHE